MRNYSRIFFLFFLKFIYFLWISVAHAASFNCKADLSEVERLICNNPTLSQLDLKMVELYRNASLLTDRGSELLAEQRNWLRQRNQCNSVACLKNSYQKRISALQPISGSQDPQLSLGLSDILGKMFILSAGSSGGTFMLTTGVQVKTRNTVEVSYIDGWMAWSDSNVVIIDPVGEQVIDASTIIIDCKGETYAPDTYATDGYRTKIFFAGAAYDWGDYSAGDFVSLSSDKDLLTDYMRKVCEFTERF